MKIGRHRSARAALAAFALVMIPSVAAAEAQEGEPPREDEGGEPVEDAVEAERTTTVTALRSPRPLRDVPAATVVLPRGEIDRSPSLTLDNLLRTVPSVATFRRSSSLVADPTSQGLNLRGVGPSGVSRSLVLVDGVPLNDPFGGSIFWRAVPRLGIERIEIVPSGGSALYGSAALGGVVQIVTRDVEEDAFEGDVALGTHDTLFADLRAAERVGDFGAAFEAELLRSDGWVVVAPGDRGPVDRDAPSIHGAVNGQLAWDATEDLELSLRGGFFREDQSGGTTFTDASVRVGHGALRARFDAGGLGALHLTAYARAQALDQRRARVLAGRTDESIAAVQHVPADEEGASLQWTAGALPFFGAHALSVGVDVRRVQGVSEERIFPPDPGPSSTLRRDAGGEQQFAGAYVADLWSVAPFLDLHGALRVDAWRNLDGRLVVERGDGSVAETRFDERVEAEVSPRLGALVRVGEPLRLRASVYRSFRAPTLNELYRPFQVGTIRTAANAALQPERLWGAEAGFEVSSGALVTTRVTGFWNEVEAPIGNVTLPAPLPDGSQRQRRNLGAASVRGVEVGLETRPTRALSLLVAYTLVDARVTRAPELPDLVGKQLPQDPLHRGAASATWSDPRWFTATVQARASGPQFEDDLNERPMGGFVVLDAAIRRRLVAGLEIYAQVENLLDEQYLVGRAGVDTIGQPFTALVGLRLRDLR